MRDREMMKMLQIIVLSLILGISSFAQNKIAVVDTSVFYDEKLGISELVTANKRLDAEFKPIEDELKLLNEKLKKVVEGVENLSQNYILPLSEVEKKIGEKQVEAQSLSNKIKLIVDEAKPLFEKRRSEIVEPVNKRITEKLKEFAKQKDFTTILEDLDKQGCVCYGSVCITYAEYPNVTKEFIKFCNKEFEKEKKQKQ